MRKIRKDGNNDLKSLILLIKGPTVFENHRKKSHSRLRAKRATFTFSRQFGEFLRQTVLPDRPIHIGQKLAKMLQLK